MESSKGSLRFDEFPTSMKPRNPEGSRATRLLALKTQDRQSLDAGLTRRTGTQGLRRLRFPFFTSQCQRAVEGRPQGHTSEPPMEANPPPRVNDSRSVSRVETRSSPASVRWIARSRNVPQEVGTTRAKRLCKRGLSPCQGLGNRMNRPKCFSP